MKNPIWSELTNHGLITVHPLGGCIIAEDAERGVVNHKGQVFGVSGERTCTTACMWLMARSSSLTGSEPTADDFSPGGKNLRAPGEGPRMRISYDLPSAPPAPLQPSKLGIQFTETMRGHFSTRVLGDYQRAAERGKRDDSPFEFTLTIISNDLDKMLDDQDHKAKDGGQRDRSPPCRPSL